MESRFIRLAEQINASMPEHVVNLIADALNEDGKPLHGSRVLILGAAYKRDVADIRESPALDIIAMLRAKKAQLAYHDPFVPAIDFERLTSIALSDEALAQTDCAVIVTDHSCFDHRRIANLTQLIIDTRNAIPEGCAGTAARGSCAYERAYHRRSPALSGRILPMPALRKTTASSYSMTFLPAGSKISRIS